MASYPIVLASCSACAAALIVALAIIVPDPEHVPRTIHFGFALGFGALIVPAYGIVAADVSDRMAPHEYVHASGRMLILYGAGSAIGPIAAGLAISIFENRGFSLVIIVAQGVVVLASIWRILVEQAPQMSGNKHYIPTPVTPAIMPKFANRFSRRGRGNRR